MTTQHSTDFRSKLKQEIPLWQQEGIISEEASAQLTQRYQLDDIQKESSRLLAAVLFTLGGLLLGGGVITFVAANWEEIPTFAKVVMLFATLLAFHLTGYWLWFHKGLTRIGHALIFTGCLVFGANIGLMAQIFHVSGKWYGAFLAWSVGSLIMAYAVRSWLIGILSLATATIWFSGFNFDAQNYWHTFFPVLIAAAFLPLAWRIGSRVLYTATFVSLTFSLSILTAEKYSSGRYILLAMAVSGLLAWAVGEFHRSKNIKPEFGNPVAALGMLTLAIAAFFGSFHNVWRYSSSYDFDKSTPFNLVLPALGAGIIALVLLIHNLISSQQSQRSFLQIAVIAAAVILSICATLGATHRGDMVLLTLGANIAAFALAASAIASGLLDERRIAFWFGTLFTVILILSRFLEYESSLLLKSAAFIFCGGIVIAAGIAYENYLRRKENI